MKEKHGNFFKGKNAIIAPAILFAFFMIFGRSYEKKNDWSLVFGNAPNKLFSLLMFAFWTVVFFVLISRIFLAASKGRMLLQNDFSFNENFASKILKKYFSLLQNFPLRTAFATFFFASIPNMILSYPAIFMGDTPNQIAQMCAENGKFSGHHPLAHTIFMGVFANLHPFLGWNRAIFLAALFQSCVLHFAFACVIKILVQMKAGQKTLAVFLAYYLAHPRIQNYQFLMTKDTLYASFLTLFILLFFFFMTRKNFEKRQFVFFGASAALSILFRNEGIYIVAASFLFALFFRQKRKAAFALLLISLSLNFFVSILAFKVFKIQKGPLREMLSVPFQQTARYLKFYGSDITSQERDAIDKLLDFKSLAKKYNPNLSDPVKNTSKNNNFTGENLRAYFKAWAKMFLRHPGPYFQATLNNYYQYFYPGKALANGYSYNWGATCMENVNKRTKGDFHFPKKFQNARLAYESAREDFFELPVLRFLKMPAFYSWAAILLIFFVLYKKKRSLFACCVPIIVQFLIFITAPTNGNYGRYQFPMFVYLPIFVFLILSECCKENDSSSQIEFSDQSECASKKFFLAKKIAAAAVCALAIFCTAFSFAYRKSFGEARKGHYEFSKINSSYALLSKARIDIKNENEQNQKSAVKIEIQSPKKGAKDSTPKWFEKNGVGHMVECEGGEAVLKATCLNEGKFKVWLRACDAKRGKERIPICIDYEIFEVNGEPVFDGAKSVTHDKPFFFEREAAAGSEFVLRFKWKAHSGYKDFGKILRDLLER